MLSDLDPFSREYEIHDYFTQATDVGNSFPVQCLAPEIRHRKHYLICLASQAGFITRIQYDAIVSYIKQIKPKSAARINFYSTKTLSTPWINLKLFTQWVTSLQFKTNDGNVYRAEEVFVYYEAHQHEYTFMNTVFNDMNCVVSFQSADSSSTTPAPVHRQVAVNEVTFDDTEEQTKTHNIEKPELTFKQAVMSVVTPDTDGDHLIGQSDIQLFDPDKNKVVTNEELRVGSQLSKEQYEEAKAEAAVSIEKQEIIVEPAVVIHAEQEEGDIAKKVVHNPHYRNDVSFYINLLVYLLTQQYPQSDVDWFAYLTQAITITSYASRIDTNIPNLSGLAHARVIGSNVTEIIQHLNINGQPELNAEDYTGTDELNPEEFESLNETLKELEKITIDNQVKLDHINCFLEDTKARLRVQDIVDGHPTFLRLVDRVSHIESTYVRR